MVVVAGGNSSKNLDFDAASTTFERSNANIHDKKEGKKDGNISTRNLNINLLENPVKAVSRKKRALDVFDSAPVTIFMSIVTIYALYGDDLKYVAFDISSELTFTWLSSIACFLFLIEMVVQAWCREGYLLYPTRGKLIKARLKSSQTYPRNYWAIFKHYRDALQLGSFYFWLDFLGTASMFAELPWLFPSDDSWADGLNSARAGKASRAGARAARVVRIIRMIRLVRLVKLYKYFAESWSKKKGEAQVQPEANSIQDEELDNMPPESRVGAEMSDRTTKKVIVGILIMLICVPLLQPNDLEFIKDFRMNMALDAWMAYDEVLTTNPNDVPQQSVYERGWTFSETELIDNTELVYLRYTKDGDTMKELFPEGRSHPSELRSAERENIAASKDGYILNGVFDASARAFEEAWMGMALTTFVIIILAFGTWVFSNDVNNLVIIPIERMVQLVREISANPLGSDFTKQTDLVDGKDGMETTLLLRTIAKLAKLMKVGFGEAGAEIIAENLKMHNDEDGVSGGRGGSSMNLLGAGRKIYSIFAFCDIRNFTDTTECLQEEVMLFVNRIAHILHSHVDLCGGAANKNIGDAFLLTWKMKGEVEGAEPADIGFAADKALLSLVKTMIEMERHHEYICDFSPLASSDLNARMPGYRCRIGCGLHYGWAVEGAIGTETKIDATYISPHVYLSEFLEGSTKTYSVPLLMSTPFFNLLSPTVQELCRTVDYIKRSKDEPPSNLFTYPCNLNRIATIQENPSPPTERLSLKNIVTKSIRNRKGGNNALSKHHSSKGFQEISRRISEAKIAKEEHDAAVGGPKTPVITLPAYDDTIWTTDADLILVRSNFQEEHRKMWRRVLRLYKEGRWAEAKLCICEYDQMTTAEDGPSEALWKFMEETDFVPPPNWNGYCDMTSG